MNRLALVISLLCISAHPVLSWDFMTQEEIDAHIAMQPCTIDPDRWGIREPIQEEIEAHGQGIMVFEYYNSPAGCSDGYEAIGVWHGDTRWGTMKVEVLGREYDSNERITFIVEDVPYTTLGHHVLVVPDAPEPHTIILYPLMY